jgi:Flp pilus assembly protein TadG
MNIRNYRVKERGQSMTELAISMVFLLILLAGVVDIGRALFAFVALRDAAEEGAIYGSIYPYDTPGIIDRVRHASWGPVNLANTSDVFVTVTTVGAACEGNIVRVNVTHQLPIVTPFMGSILGSQTININATIDARILRPPC